MNHCCYSNPSAARIYFHSFPLHATTLTAALHACMCVPTTCIIVCACLRNIPSQSRWEFLSNDICNLVVARFFMWPGLAWHGTMVCTYTNSIKQWDIFATMFVMHTRQFCIYTHTRQQRNVSDMWTDFVCTHAWLLVHLRGQHQRSFIIVFSCH